MKKKRKKIDINKKQNTYDNPTQKKVKSDTSTRPAKDTNPLPPNPNEVDNHNGGL